MPVSDMKHKAQTVDEYFARLPSRECVEVCNDLIDGYYTEATRSGRVALYRTAFYDYYEGFLVKGQLYRKGAQGEQTGITVNNFHNFIKHRVTMTCQQKLAYEPQAVDGSHKALEQVRLAKGILGLYSERPDIDLDGKFRKAVQWCQLFMESYVAILWDGTKGKPVTVDFEDGDKIIPEGDIEVKVYDPLAVVRDVYRSSADDQWYILREEVNKVDLAVQYPQFEKDIMAESLDAVYKDRQIFPCYSTTSDIIWVWTLYHKETLAVPKGRKLRFISSEIVLEDGQLPEEYCGELPIHRMAAEDLAGSPWGYTDAMDALPICNAISRLHSTVLTNNITFGLQHIAVPRDANFTESQMGNGLTLLECDPAKWPNSAPVPINLTKSAPETYDYINTLTMTAGTLMGINEATKANPDLVIKGQASGAALAILTTQAIQFNADLSKAYQHLAECAGTAIIRMLDKKSVVPRQGRTVGMSGKPYSREFKNGDLGMIDKVIVKTGNPLAQTTAGRMQIAESLLNGQFIKNRQEYLAVLETGNLEPMLESQDMEISLIKSENDVLSKGELTPAAVFDDHVNHIAEHKVILASPEARKNPQVVKAVTAHIQEHLGFLAGDAQHGPMNPILASIGNQPTLPPGTPSSITLPPPPAAPPPGLRPPMAAKPPVVPAPPARTVPAAPVAPMPPMRGPLQ
jgi:hypothetical protein